MSDTGFRFEGFASPRTARGQAGAYGEPPWRMTGRVLTVWLRLGNPEEALAHVPPPLDVVDDPVVRVRFWDIQHDAGFGDSTPARDPLGASFREVVFAIPVRFGDRTGEYPVHGYSDDPVYTAWAREVIGWPLKGGRVILSEPWRDEELRAGTELTGLLERGGRSLLEVRTRVTGRVPESKLPTESNKWFTYKVVPRADGPGLAVHQLVMGGPEHIQRGEVWALDLREIRFGGGPNDELQYFEPGDFVRADYWPNVSLSVGYGEILADLLDGDAL